MAASIQLICHSSVIIEIDGIKFLCDPWLLGKCFNDSWALAIPSAKAPEEVENVDYLWISHEHPDHFHLPTLKAFSPAFKSRVKVLFKTDFTEKVPEALRALGFKSITMLPHRKEIILPEGIVAYCYHSRVMDSALVLRKNGVSILNSNDAELTPKDCRNIVKDTGPVDVILDQYGIAGYPGMKDFEPTLARMKENKLKNYVMHLKETQAKVSIPFASFHYFCSQENAFLNKFLATPKEVAERVWSVGGDCKILFPGDSWTLGEAWDSKLALERFESAYSGRSNWPLSDPGSVSVEKLIEAQARWVEALSLKFPQKLLKKIGSIRVRLHDLDGRIFSFSPIRKQFEEVFEAQEPTFETGSQALHFAFTNSFGFQTLGVSGRYLIQRSSKELRWLRILMSAHNTGISLKLSRLFRGRSLGYLWSRRREAVDQLRDRIKTMF